MVLSRGRGGSVLQGQQQRCSPRAWAAEHYRDTNSGRRRNVGKGGEMKKKCRGSEMEKEGQQRWQDGEGRWVKAKREMEGGLARDRNGEERWAEAARRCKEGDGGIYNPADSYISKATAGRDDDEEEDVTNDITSRRRHL
ncbi:hypothetical protein Sjap_026065 [Stephania japonica]|uniref:Uncharacterized protein n=1 Tax=Stephania japonica TaxID=461633 RepID=A0AAP0E2X7_9MAGN